MNRLLILRQMLMLLLLGLTSITPNVFAQYAVKGGESRDCCLPFDSYTGGHAEIALTEGNLREPLPALAGSVAHTLDLRLTYNSYNADFSHAQVDSVAGYGWTHSYNSFLFTQVGSMFLMGPDGRTEKFQLGAGGTYTADPGYFNKLVQNPDGSFTLTTKDKTVSQFAIVPGTPFMVGGPVYRLLSITDRNNNITILTYTGGNLVKITDTYGRFLTLTYNASGHLKTVTDPNNHTTMFDYDGTGRRLARVTDPTGKTLLYTYNTLNQMLSRTDRDGRRFTFQYRNNLPVGMKDSTGSNIFSLTNSSNWATSFPDLAMYQERVYIPSTTQKTDGRGNLWRYQYDAHGYVTNVIAPDGATTSYSYDPATLRVATMTDANGNITSYEYDAQGNRTKITLAAPFNYITTFTYEPVFNMVTSMTDPKLRVTRYEYDARGNRIREIDPLLQTRRWTYDNHGNVLTETDKRGNTTTYTYDAGGNRITIIAPPPLSCITRMTYDSVGNLKTRTDPNMHTTLYDYDGLNRLIKQTDPAGNFDQYDYDGEGHRIKVTDRNEHATMFQYDQRERLIKTTDCLAQSDTYTYDANNNRTSKTDKNGHSTTYQYDVQNRLSMTTDALGCVTSMAYDPVGNMTSMNDGNGHTTSYTYDALNRRSTVTDALGYVTIFEYDTGGSSGCGTCGVTPGTSIVTKQTDGNGKVTYFKYDKLDRLIKVVRKEGDVAPDPDPSDAVTSYTYDRNNNLLTMTEPDGNTTTYQYDVLNRRTRETNAAGDITRFNYDCANNVRTVTAPNGNLTTNTYDALDRVIQVDDSIGRVMSYTYDNVGNRLSQTDGNGNTTGYTYDCLNRLTIVTDPLTRTTATQYDPVGNVLRRIDRNGNTTTYVYDNINRRIRITEALGNVTRYQYDCVGNLKKITDAKPPPRTGITTYDYDNINRLIKETFPDAPPNMRIYTYDAVNLLTRTDQKGQTTHYLYNDLYFLLHRTYPVSPADNMTYDLSGRMLTAGRGGWLVTFTYDGANRVTQTTQNSKTIGYSYNIPGRTRMLTYPGGRQITEHTDARTRLDHIDDASSPPPIVQYSYDLGNRVGTRTYRNGVVASYSYNANDWITSLEHTNGATSVAGFGYDYDNEGNKKFEEKRQDTSHSESYHYDNIYRLVDYKVGPLPGPTPIITQTSYNLDAVGNWNRKITDSVTQTRMHNAVNELTMIDATNLIYDDNGNLQQDATFTYAYDEENRLTKVTRNSDSAVVGQYQYDALSRRVQKIANPAGGPSTIRYYHDAARILEEEDAGGATQATYVYGNYIDEVLTMDRGGQTYYYHPNSLWSVEAITDATGAAVERYSYDAYGQPSVFTGSGTPIPPNIWGTPHSAIGNSYTFTARQLDEESGLYFYRARYYDAAKGRFVQRDPAGYVDGMNLYMAYFAPMGLDPDGLWKCDNGDTGRLCDAGWIDEPKIELLDYHGWGTRYAWSLRWAGVRVGQYTWLVDLAIKYSWYCTICCQGKRCEYDKTSCWLYDHDENHEGGFKIENIPVRVPLTAPYPLFGAPASAAWLGRVALASFYGTEITNALAKPLQKYAAAAKAYGPLALCLGGEVGLGKLLGGLTVEVEHDAVSTPPPPSAPPPPPLWRPVDPIFDR